MGKFEDLTGQKFGRWTVLELYDKDGKSTFWKCQCGCGKVSIVRAANLKRNRTHSCGCLRGELISARVSKSFAESAINRLFGAYERGAKDRDLEFSLTKQQFVELTQRNCYYCGIEPYSIYKSRGNGRYIYNGIDRVNNTQGYSIENCVPCCKNCNYAKGTKTQSEFFKWLKRAYEHLTIMR